MNEAVPTQVAGLILLIGLAGLARPAVADPRPLLSIVLHVCDDDSIPPNVVSRAKAEMTRMYRDAGINVVWTDQAPTVTGPASSPSLTSSGLQLTLIIVSREMTDELTVATRALGATASTREYRGRMAYVFYNRVERVARTYVHTSRTRATYDIDNVIVLEDAMAHEIGHLLLPYGHSATGLMRADWDGKDLGRAVHGQLKFTPQQAELIRTRLSQLAGVQSLDSR